MYATRKSKVEGAARKSMYTSKSSESVASGRTLGLFACYTK